MSVFFVEYSIFEILDNCRFGFLSEKFSKKFFFFEKRFKVPRSSSLIDSLGLESQHLGKNFLFLQKTFHSSVKSVKATCSLSIFCRAAPNGVTGGKKTVGLSELLKIIAKKAKRKNSQKNRKKFLKKMYSNTVGRAD